LLSDYSFCIIMLLSTAVSYKYMNLFRQPIPSMLDKDVAEVSVRAYFNVPGHGRAWRFEIRA